MLIRNGTIAAALAGLMMSGGAALAAPFSITTTGIVTSGSDSANLLGAGTTIVGDAYVLTEEFSGLGSGYSTDGTGQFASDFGDAIPGSITVTIAGHTTTTVFAVNVASSLSEDTSDLNGSNSGNDPTGTYVSAVQSIGSATTSFIPFADLQTSFSYALAAGDSGTDSFTLTNAANTQTATFGGTTSGVEFAVPEPASLSLLGLGLLGLAAIRRRAA